LQTETRNKPTARLKGVVRILIFGIIIGVAISSPAYTSAQLSGKPSSTETQQIASGKELFHEHCASCHFTDTTAQKIGPGLKGLYSRLAFSDGKKVSDASLAKWIETGGKNMPGFKETMRPEQIRALISYVRTL
jgi:mono/diheme cytochrome c family protein